MANARASARKALIRLLYFISRSREFYGGTVCIGGTCQEIRGQIRACRRPPGRIAVLQFAMRSKAGVEVRHQEPAKVSLTNGVSAWAAILSVRHHEFRALLNRGPSFHPSRQE